MFFTAMPGWRYARGQASLAQDYASLRRAGYPRWRCWDVAWLLLARCVALRGPFDGLIEWHRMHGMTKL